MSSGWIGEGPHVKEFERQIAALMGKKYAVSTTSGTVALSLALMAVGIKPGDRVVVPDYSFVATANAVKLVGAEPCLVDIDYDTLCMSGSAIEDAIAQCKPKCIIAVHFNARVMVPEHYTRFGLPVIEDAAAALGVESAGYGIMTCVSFSVPKIITTGQGGMVLTDDPDLATSLRQFKDHGRTEHGGIHHHVIGYNFRITELTAALGLAQLKKYGYFRSCKKASYEAYDSKLPVVKSDLPWFAMVRVPNLGECINHLAEAGIEAKQLYLPIHRQGAYSHPALSDDLFPNSIKAAETVLTLPSSATLAPEQAERIATTLLGVTVPIDPDELAIETQLQSLGYI